MDAATMEIKPSMAEEAHQTSDSQSAVDAAAAAADAAINDAAGQCQNTISAGEKRKREAEEDGKGDGEQTIDGGQVGSGGGVDVKGGELQHSSYWKTSLCSYYRRQPQGGERGCSHGDACRYAHSEAELRPRPNNTWDPTSERAKKLLRSNEETLGTSAEDRNEVFDMDSLDKCIVGLPKRWVADNLKSFLNDQGILFKTAKKKKGMAVGFVNFEDTEQLKSAMEVLAKESAGGKQIKLADANRRSHEKKIGVIMSCGQDRAQNISREQCIDHTGVTKLAGSDNEHNDGEKDAAMAEVPLKTRNARDVVTPLADISYEDQLEQKKNSLMQILKKLTRNARKACPADLPLPDWINKSKEIGALPCKLEGILASPLINGYRNKCEFSVGYSTKGELTVGFMAGNFREGITAVEEPVNCPNVSRISCEYALVFQNFLQSSVLTVWDRIENKGFWRQFTVREGRVPGNATLAENKDYQIAEVMLVIQVCSLGVDEDVMKIECKKLSEALACGAAMHSPPLPLTTIVVQDHTGISNAAPADSPLIPLPVPKVEGHSHSEKQYGTEARIHDYISNLRFSISPTAFFQVNTLAAEKLYSLAGDWADLSPDTLLFDICCGTGTIGLTLAHRVGMVVGIEMNESAVSDAQRNAVINGIKNCRFACGKAEDVIGALLKEYLDVPQQHGSVSSCSLTTDSANNDNILDGVAHETILEADTCASIDNQPLETNFAGLSGQELSREINLEKNLDNHIEENYASEKQINISSDKNFDGATGAMGSATGCSSISEKNLEGNDLILSHCTTEVKKKESAACQFKDIVAIVDPPRVGLHPVVIKALRTHPRIRRLVYISCNPESLVANAIELCTPTAEKTEKAKGNKGWRNMSSASLARQRIKSMPNSEPFRPVKAIAVDLFPHTPHCELVMLLER